jgi:FAD/FMN-containing dehydrogenase
VLGTGLVQLSATVRNWVSRHTSAQAVLSTPSPRGFGQKVASTIGDLDHESQALGLAVPMGVVTATGIAGLTLAGGIGWLRRKYELSCDNLISADVVTAKGELVITSSENNADLLWALQGGGGNFGVVTSFEFRAYPVGPDVFFAFVVHPGTRRDAQAALVLRRMEPSGIG